MQEQDALYPVCIFVCTNNRGSAEGVRVSCGVQGAEAIRIALKTACKTHGVQERVRVHSSGCMEGCEIGPNVLLEPAHRLYSGVTMADVDAIIARHIASEALPPSAD